MPLPVRTRSSAGTSCQPRLAAVIPEASTIRAGQAVAPAGVIPLPVTSPTTTHHGGEPGEVCLWVVAAQVALHDALVDRPSVEVDGGHPSRSTATSAPIPTIVPLAGASGTRLAPTAARGRAR